MADLTTFGLYKSTQSFISNISVIPYHTALRNIVPRFPGSDTPSSIRIFLVITSISIFLFISNNAIIS